MTPYATHKFQATDGFALTYRYWKAQKPQRVVFCIHGLGDYSGWFSNVAPDLVADGSEVYALDLRGFGESVQQPSQRGRVDDFLRHLQDIDDFVAHLRNLHSGKRLFLFGHSLGGVYSVWYAANHSGSVDGLVLAAPAVACDINKTCTNQKRDPQEIAIMKNDPLETWAPPSSYLFDVEKLLLSTALENSCKIAVSTLIVQGDADVTVQLQGARDLYAKLAAKDKNLVILNGVGHWFDDALCPVTPRSKSDAAKRQQFIALVKDWLRNH